MVANLLTYPNLLWQNEPAGLLAALAQGKSPDAMHCSGQFSLFRESADHYLLVRDRLGINKLFYFLHAPSGRFIFGNNLHDVCSKVGSYNEVYSVPAGHFLSVDRKSFGKTLTPYYDLSRQPAPAAFDLGAFHERVHRQLEKLFTKLASDFDGADFLVCLSGGLDSSVVAHYASRYLKNVTAVTFGFSERGEDFAAAREIAGALGLNFFPVIRERKFDPQTLREVLIDGQDSRDFNVHCAWVNRILAAAIAERAGGKKCVVLTGDLMNEYVADYAPVEYAGQTFYALPKISRGRLRQFLTMGLDVGDREVGIFRRFGLSLVQPYSVLAEEYLAVPAEKIDEPKIKETLNMPLLDNAKARTFIHQNKMRAQVGDKGGGVLGLFIDNGIGQKELDSAWREIFMAASGERELRPMIVSGRYRN